MHLLNFPLLLGVQIPARKYAFSISELKKKKSKKQHTRLNHSIQSHHDSQYIAPDTVKKRQLMQYSSPAVDKQRLTRMSLLFLVQTPH